MKHPDTAALAKAAFDATGCKTHGDFVNLMGGAIGLRTLRRWLAGEGPADPLAQLVLRELVAGWRPGRTAPSDRFAPGGDLAPLRTVTSKGGAGNFPVHDPRQAK